MEIRNFGRKKVLIADNNCHIRDINDIYEKEHYDEEGNLIPQKKPYYTSVIFLADNFDDSKLNELYIEEIIDEKIEEVEK